MQKKLLSGMRPTGNLHLGHLVGALDNWIKLQEKFECFYMVADWHALMSEYEDPKNIEKNSIEMLADWISCGIDPKRSTVFVQSHVKEHLELDMVFSCFVPLPLLERNPTYKEQLREMSGRNLMTYGFLGYPVLQASDILVYRAQVVPVGIDQAAHLELTREIARKFNNLYGKLFPEPETLLTATPKLLGIDNRKMSKSFRNFITLSDNPHTIKKSVMAMITDPKKIRLDDIGHPQVCTVCNYYKVFAPEMSDEIFSTCSEGKRGCIKCKEALTDILIQRLEPIRRKREKLLDDKAALTDILRKGNEKARDITSQTMSEVRKKVGIFHDL
ncbi:MAG: tryptophan--tRNA ligase [Omnitrophica bacterium RBG_13_46_9]|nr:MAG: tryptophan--tRNA ligase [Omnitrophica bacterium RBG_13_46_9]